jgi:hypothetical protein
MNITNSLNLERTLILAKSQVQLDQMFHLEAMLTVCLAASGQQRKSFVNVEIDKLVRIERFSVNVKRDLP